VIFKAVAIVILVLFYSSYVLKIILQNKKGIQTDQIAKGQKDKKVFVTEAVMKFATYSVILVEVLSIIYIESHYSIIIQIAGSILGIIGVLVFIISIYTMKNSWRAGIAVNDETDLIVNGIYGYSRNPAFLGFDLVYIGILMMFFNVWLLLFSMFAIIMLHVQILQEEKHLPKMFGNDYTNYKKKVRRYL